MQAEVDNLKLIAVEDLVRSTISTMVFINHICHVILKIRSAPWGSFRTPRSERLMADIGILSMLCESTAIVSVKGLLYLYQFIYFQNASLLKLLHEFTVYTSVPLVIEWFFTGVSLAIETCFQNIAVMAAWRKRWKRYILVANILEVGHGRFDECNECNSGMYIDTRIFVNLSF